jgi:hypothetical protein
MKWKWHWICRECGEKNHIADDVCIHCDLADYWDQQAAYHEREAARYREKAAAIRPQMKAKKQQVVVAP